MNASLAIPFESPFAFAVCNAGSEVWLKADVAARHGTLLRPAFMRPQLITWKSDSMLGPDFALASPFARLSGLSLGSAKTESDIIALAAKLGARPLHLHVFPREVPENGLAQEEWARLDAWRDRIAATLRSGGIVLEETLEAGAMVLDVIVESSPDAPFFVGVHLHGPGSHGSAGGLARVTLLPEAPSRAWLKLEQALAWAGLDGMQALTGKMALELGCAPGGATYALLQRGVSVVGVDTAAMDPRVTEFTGPEGARLIHLAMAVGEVPAALVPRQVDMLVSDLNLAPPVMLRYVERFQKHVRAKLLVLTVKLNDDEMVARIPSFIETIRSFAPIPMRVTQLPANRAELCVVAGSL
ncbi:MAG: SAM-dependent methyltransferase [Roseimicrobium sp.]